MFKISGAYSDDVAEIVDRLNESAKKLENYTIDGDTQGMLLYSFRDLNKISMSIVINLVELQNKLIELTDYIQSEKEHE